MNVNDAILDRVRRVDPVDALEVLDWTLSDDARRVLDDVTRAEIVTLGSPRRHRGRRIAIAAVAVTGGLVTARAAADVLGGPAPDRVRAHLAALDEGMPADLRLDPDLDHARAVASTTSGVLYAADLTSGGYCLEVVTDGDRPRGAVCVTAADLGESPLEITAPIPDEPDGVILVGGRINDDRVQQVEIRYADGQTSGAASGLEGYWLFEVSADERQDALNTGLVVAGIDADGVDVVTVSVPPLRDDDPDGTKFDRLQPILLSTISSGDDFTLLLGVEGSLNAADAATLELQYPDGATTMIAVAPDGSYRFIVPTDREHDFASATGALIARDATGQIVATVAVTSVANAHGTESSPTP
ncbi:MAG: hypothetical protein ABIW84_01365 [Ilumatobacteraceae bacterium]